MREIKSTHDHCQSKKWRDCRWMVHLSACQKSKNIWLILMCFLHNQKLFSSPQFDSDNFKTKPNQTSLVLLLNKRSRKFSVFDECCPTLHKIIQQCCLKYEVFTIIILLIDWLLSWVINEKWFIDWFINLFFTSMI